MKKNKLNFKLSKTKNIVLSLGLIIFELIVNASSPYWLIGYFILTVIIVAFFKENSGLLLLGLLLSFIYYIWGMNLMFATNLAFSIPGWVQYITIYGSTIVTIFSLFYLNNSFSKGEKKED